MSEIYNIKWLDENGYPTEELLSWIENYHPDKDIPIREFITKVLPEVWAYAQWGVRFQEIPETLGSKKCGTLELHTGGWSGNELIIRAIKENILLTHGYMQYRMWKAGGHYYFDIQE